MVFWWGEILSFRVECSNQHGPDSVLTVSALNARDPEHRWHLGARGNAGSRLQRFQVCGLGVVRHCDQMYQAHQTSTALIESILFSSFVEVTTYCVKDSSRRRSYKGGSIAAVTS